jgi:cytochrome c556
MKVYLYLLCSFLAVAPVMAADVTPVNAADLASRGIGAYNRKDFPTAIKFLHARAGLAPQDPVIFYYLGNCYMQAKQHEHAAKLYSACIRCGPGTEASKHALSALETLSTMPKAPPPPVESKPELPDPKAAEASRDALPNTAAVDKAFNDAVTRIRNNRQTFKIKVDNHWHRLQEDLTAMNPKNTPNYSVELERIRRETDNKIEYEQLRQLRTESRILAPDKIDVRAVPDTPKEKADDTKTALGSLSELVKPEKPFDPFGPDVNPEIAAKFLTLKDVFGELSTYQPSERRIAKQVFSQLKNSIEVKQDSFDQQVHQVKETLVRDLVHIKINYNVSGNPSYANKESTAAYHISSSKIPRSDQNNLTPADLEISQTTERAKKRLAELKDGYLRDVDSLIAVAKERVSGAVISTGQINSQLKKPSGTIQVVPLGSDSYTRNYVNFGSRDHSGSSSSPPVKQLKADPMKTIKSEKQRSSTAEHGKQNQGDPKATPSLSPPTTADKGNSAKQADDDEETDDDDAPPSGAKK